MLHGPHGTGAVQRVLYAVYLLALLAFTYGFTVARALFITSDPGWLHDRLLGPGRGSGRRRPGRGAHGARARPRASPRPGGAAAARGSTTSSPAPSTGRPPCGSGGSSRPPCSSRARRSSPGCSGVACGRRARPGRPSLVVALARRAGAGGGGRRGLARRPGRRRRARAPTRCRRTHGGSRTRAPRRSARPPRCAASGCTDAARPEHPLHPAGRRGARGRPAGRPARGRHAGAPRARAAAALARPPRSPSSPATCSGLRRQPGPAALRRPARRSGRRRGRLVAQRPGGAGGARPSWRWRPSTSASGCGPRGCGCSATPSAPPGSAAWGWGPRPAPTRCSRHPCSSSSRCPLGLAVHALVPGTAVGVGERAVWVVGVGALVLAAQWVAAFRGRPPFLAFLPGRRADGDDAVVRPIPRALRGRRGAADRPRRRTRACSAPPALSLVVGGGR